MYYTQLRLLGVQKVVVLVEPPQLASHYADPFIHRLQRQFAMPAMLVARDNGTWQGVRAYAHVDAVPYLHALLMIENVEWLILPEPPEPELPF